MSQVNAIYKNFTTSSHGIGKFGFINIKGTGYNKEKRVGKEPRMVYSADLIIGKDSPILKEIKIQAEALWDEFKTTYGYKGALTYGYNSKCVGITPHRIPDPEGTIDPETEAVQYIDTGDWVIKAYTNVSSAKGDTIVKVFDHKGTDISTAYQNVEWNIGSDSTGGLMVSLCANDAGGTPKVTIYLQGVQVAKLVKYEGNTMEIVNIEGEDIDLDGGMPAIVDTEAGDTEPDIA